MNEREEIRTAAWRAVADADCLVLLAAHVSAMNGWSCTRRTAESIVSKWLSPDERRPLPAYLLPLIVRMTGRARKGHVG